MPTRNKITPIAALDWLKFHSSGHETMILSLCRRYGLVSHSRGIICRGGEREHDCIGFPPTYAKKQTIISVCKWWISFVASFGGSGVSSLPTTLDSLNGIQIPELARRQTWHVWVCLHPWTLLVVFERMRADFMVCLFSIDYPWLLWVLLNEYKHWLLFPCPHEEGNQVRWTGWKMKTIEMKCENPWWAR